MKNKAYNYKYIRKIVSVSTYISCLAEHNYSENVLFKMVDDSKCEFNAQLSDEETQT